MYLHWFVELWTYKQSEPAFQCGQHPVWTGLVFKSLLLQHLSRCGLFYSHHIKLFQTTLNVFTVTLKASQSENIRQKWLKHLNICDEFNICSYTVNNGEIEHLINWSIIDQISTLDISANKVHSYVLAWIY